MANIVQPTHPSHPRQRDEAGAASAEYAVVTAAGVGIGGILIKLLTSDWGQALLKKLLDTFLAMVGVA
jgi:Flp pilus assembly pilin Flp